MQAVHLRRSLVRRRRTLLILAGATAVAALAAMGSGASAAWWALAVVLVAGVAYMGLLHRARRIAAEREFASIFGPSFSDFRMLRDISIAAERGSEQKPAERANTYAPPGRGQHGWALLHFAAASLAGWALSPLVFALTLIIGEKPKDTTGQRWLANLQTAQERMREQSLRAIAVSAATTASVTAAGTVAAFGGGGVASAATISASASMAASPGLPAGASLGANMSGGTPYRVVAGDTLSGIAHRFGTTTSALAAANGIGNPDVILSGQIITVPGGSAAAAVRPSSTYTVVAGDTLGGIAARFGTTVAALASANNISNPDFIVPGEVISFGGGASGRATATRATATQVTATLTAASSAPTPAAAPASSSAAQVAVQAARDQIGKPYQWAGAGPGSFDCSGLVMYAWGHAGVSLPHYSVSQYQDTARISQAELRPGDLVFYNTGDGAEPGHVTIYIGDGQVITADSPGTYVKVVPLNWDGTPMGFGRVG